MRKESWHQFYDLASDQHAAVTRSQAAACGIPTRTFDRRVIRERWSSPHAGVVLLPGSTRCYAQDVSAALLATGPHAVAAFFTAAHLWSMRHCPVRPIALLVHNDEHYHTRRGVRVARSRTLLPQDRATVTGLRVTSPDRTIIDLARVMPVDDLRALLIDAAQRGVVELDDVAARLACMNKPPGRHKLQRLLGELSVERIDSVFEGYVRDGCRDRGLHPAPGPWPVRLRQGGLAHVDIAWPEVLVGVECDGRIAHGSSLQQAADHRRQHALEDAGWLIRRLNWWRWMHERDTFFSELRDALASRGARV